ncbi:MAG: ferredoxin [Bacilli bacterium]|jgi:ferredoxin|nr:ferredoxin [Bacilli bacterium]
MAKVRVNPDLCIGCGACTGISDVFTFNDEGKAEVTGEINADNEAAVEEAKVSCPVGAIEDAE